MKPLLEKFIKDRHIEKSTAKGYLTTIKQYTEFHETNINDLILEAWNDETEHQQMYERRLPSRINEFRNSLIGLNTLEAGTINNKITKLQTFYTHYGVTFPKINGIKDKKKQITYFDLPNVEHIQMALESTSIQNQALILFLASSGTGKSETANITIFDFIDATQEYHNGGNLEEILDTLYAVQEPLVPTFALMRQKTLKQYYTFCTPEASFAIIRYLKHRLKIAKMKNETIELSEPLFGMNVRSISDRLRVINDNLGFGFKGKYRFFRPHTLRKFHASNIGLSEEHIDMLQGRSKDTVHDTYIKSNPKHLKQIYMGAMDNVTINLEGQRTVVNEEYNINLHLHFHDEGGLTTHL